MENVILRIKSPLFSLYYAKVCNEFARFLCVIVLQVTQLVYLFENDIKSKLRKFYIHALRLQLPLKNWPKT